MTKLKIITDKERHCILKKIENYLTSMGYGLVIEPDYYKYTIKVSVIDVQPYGVHVQPLKKKEVFPNKADQ